MHSSVYVYVRGGGGTENLLSLAHLAYDDVPCFVHQMNLHVCFVWL